ncbi:hypothetical protein K0M31_007779 [Melipona bicolor]|uniref:Uncharacterized protein n=1 Tax=Melipona bicolor TaxID=60889 RepID=A0AA40GC13_9HYME|nr:hypothetical protein K0M31_007779 [Melipona bicolor]
MSVHSPRGTGKEAANGLCYWNFNSVNEREGYILIRAKSSTEEDIKVPVGKEIEEQMNERRFDRRLKREPKPQARSNSIYWMSTVNYLPPNNESHLFEPNFNQYPIK